MALRKQVSDVFKLSYLITNRACMAASTVDRNIYRCHPLEKQVNEKSWLGRNKSLSVANLDRNLLKTSNRENLSLEYQCPSGLSDRLSQMIILDKQVNKCNYHLPLGNPVVTSLIDPQSQSAVTEITDPIPSQHKPAKEAKIIMKIRHLKMKKHKRIKLAKRMYYVWKKQADRKIAKELKKFDNELAEIKKVGDDFDAEEFVKDQLQKARKGGFYVNVFDSHN